MLPTQISPVGHFEILVADELFAGENSLQYLDVTRCDAIQQIRVEIQADKSVDIVRAGVPLSIDLYEFLQGFSPAAVADTRRKSFREALELIACFLSARPRPVRGTTQHVFACAAY
jgi:hypothetical protein